MFADPLHCSNADIEAGVQSLRGASLNATSLAPPTLLTIAATSSATSLAHVSKQSEGSKTEVRVHGIGMIRCCFWYPADGSLQC